jgi:hypothetical protein
MGDATGRSEIPGEKGRLLVGEKYGQDIGEGCSEAVHEYEVRVGMQARRADHRVRRPPPRKDDVRLALEA